MRLRATPYTKYEKSFQDVVYVEVTLICDSSADAPWSCAYAYQPLSRGPCYFRKLRRKPDRARQNIHNLSIDCLSRKSDFV